MIRYEIEQDTEAWYNWRAGGIGASVSAAVLGVDPYTSRDEAFGRMVGTVAQPYFNSHMRRGKLLEPIIRRKYEALFGWAMEPLCVAYDGKPWLMASLDGIKADDSLILEIKAPAEKGQNKVWASGIPDGYYCQVQHQLLITGSRACHFVSYNEEVPAHRQFYLETVEADRDFQEHLLEELTLFWTSVQDFRQKHLYL